MKDNRIKTGEEKVSKRISLIDKTDKAQTNQRLKQDHLQFEPLGGAADEKQELRRREEKKAERQVLKEE